MWIKRAYSSSCINKTKKERDGQEVSCPKGLEELVVLVQYACL